MSVVADVQGLDLKLYSLGPQDKHCVFVGGVLGASSWYTENSR